VRSELRALQREDDGVRGLESVLRYLVRVANVPSDDLQKFLALEVGRIAKEVLMSTLSEYTKEARKKARAEGHAKGRVEGRVEGLTEGQARILLKQLKVRFGALPASVERRVRRATAAERERWAGRLLRARTLAEVLRRG
jgi:flagellar biosynthesis/type III secretory pathway protein FliH